MSYKPEELKLSQEQVSIDDMENIALAFFALTGLGVTKQDWLNVLTSEKLVGDVDRLDKLGDYLMAHDQEVVSVRQLREVIQAIKV